MAIELIFRFHSGVLKWTARIKDILFHIFTLKYYIFISSTLVMIYVRLRAMDFDGPQFKAMDNPVAASENFVTRVKLKHCFSLRINIYVSRQTRR